MAEVLEQPVVYVALPIPSLKPLTYSVPRGLVREVGVGKRALVPLGQRFLTGYIIGVDASGEADRDDLKPIEAVLDQEPLLDAHLLQLTRWVSDHYLASWGLVIRTSLPPGIDRSTARIVELIAPPDVLADAFTKLLPSDRPILTELERRRRAAVSSLKRRWPARQVDRVVHYLVVHQVVRADYEERGPLVRAAGRSMICLTADSRTVGEHLATLRVRAPRQASLLERLLGSGRSFTLGEASAIAGTSGVRRLEARGLIRRLWEEVERAPRDGDEPPEAAAPPPELTPAQRAAVDGLIDGLSRGVFFAALLFGATGSGKTEVYLRVVEEVVQQGGQALVLVPEIALTPLAADRFRARFGDRVALLHSGLSRGERLDQWRRVKRGLADVVVGARSAVFAPLPRLGLIVVDEEHDASYKQDEEPRYHARDVALARGEMLGIPVILGSATPAYESFHRATEGRYRLFLLPERVEGRPLPSMTLIDMRAERARGAPGPDIVSRPLADAIAATLARGEQVLLFVNRRGYARLLLCRECGFALRCPRCSASLIYHATEARMRCHYCDHRERPPSRCPKCSGIAIGLLGYGTQQVEAALRALHPAAGVARMDRDATRRRRGHAQILRTVGQGRTQILIGTQMVGKGHDFPGITLVGVLSADASMHIPDFRAGERTYALLTQVAGRAGRGERPGHVLVQTYNPDHYCILAAAHNDYESLYEMERPLREMRGLPPFGLLVLLVASDPGADRAEQLADKLARLLGERAVPPLAVEGPAPAALYRLRGRYRWQLLAKGPDAEALHRWVSDTVSLLSPSERSKIAVDVDPIDLC
jgi:primosomal protein N' (replication factor Y)